MTMLPRLLHTAAGRTLFCSLTTVATALALGACRGAPQFLQPRSPAATEQAPPQIDGASFDATPPPHAGAQPTSVLAAPSASFEGGNPQFQQPPVGLGEAPDTRPDYRAIYEAPSSSEAPAYGPVGEPPAVHSAAPSPALSQTPASPQVRSVSHVERGAAEFTPAIARVGHTARTLPESAFTGHGSCCADPRYPPEVWHLRRDEFLCDGGDQKLAVQVNPDWTIRGLDLEDTVVHYDTLEGATEVEASNKVCIYAPRFAAVRKTVGPVLARLRQRSAGVEMPMMLVEQDEVASAGTVNQPLQPGRNVGLDQLITLKDRNLGVELEGRQLPAGLDNGFMLYENLLIIRRGEFDNSEKVRLAESIEAAAVWSEEQAVQVVVDGEQAVVQKGVLEALEIDRYEVQGKPQMRICKVASTKEAQPGDIVHFTLRFDNIGNQEVGNVTIVDNLTTRLEYVPDSAECSLKANFVPVQNEGESLVLRWEIIDPIKPGEGGIIRFKCRVR